VLDTSGSMRDAPIELLKEVCRQAASRLRDGDVVSILTWNTERIHVLDAYEVEGPSDPVVLEAVDSLRAEGRTDLHSGLVEGYAIAEAHYHAGWLNRVILVSDGEANVGVTDESAIAREADDSEREGIYIVGVGVGEGYNDTLMNAVTDAGKGAYVFIDSPEEARKMFRQRFLQTLEIAVMDVQVELTLPPILRMEVFHGEEVSGDPKEVEPQHLAPNDAMIFHMNLRGCGEPAATDIVTAVAWTTDPATKHRLSSSAAFNLPYLLESGGWQIDKGNAVVAYAEGLKKVYLATMEGGAAAAALPCAETVAAVEEGLEAIRDPELLEIQMLLDDYCRTLASRTLPDLF
jgi:Ca-activated chloride channel family protein